jgi:glycosyltransferase involved in cell wall biosynthesis
MAQHGKYPPEYERELRIAKSLDEIYEDFDRYTCEMLPGDTPFGLHSHVLLPPLQHAGVETRGILLTMATDLLVGTYPHLKDIFHILASAQWCNFPWTRSADALCSIYDNAVRDQWFRRRYPDRRCLLLPFQEADWTNERQFGPGPETRPRDLLCVSRQLRLKNLPFLAAMLKVYRRKYGPLRMTLVAGYGTRWDRLTGKELRIMQEMEEVVGHLHDYVDLEENRSPEEMPALYQSHQALVLGSLIEGKNRALHEAMASDTPVICCEAFNQYTRGSAHAFPQGAGGYAPFDEEGYADTVHRILLARRDLTPRRSYLNGFSGRSHVLERCLCEFTEFADRVPGFAPATPLDNEWLSEALQARYGCTWEQFVYGSPPHGHLRGIDEHDRALAFYSDKFQAAKLAN